MERPSPVTKNRTAGHTETTISGDTRAGWSDAFELVPSLQIAYVWQASVFTREVLNGLARIGFLYPQQIIWDKGRTVLTRTHYWYGLPVLQDECTGRCQRLRVLRAGDQ